MHVGSTQVPLPRLRSVASLACLIAFAGADAASAEDPERNVTLTPPGPANWTGTLGNGLNQNYDSASGEPCGDAVADMCDTTLLLVDVPAGFWDDQGGGVEVALDNYVPNPGSDFDLYIYESDAAGTRGALVDQSGGFPGLPESAEIPEADGYYLIQVVYFAVVASTYDAEASFFLRPAPSPEPPDVDDPPGLEDSLASNPALGYRSHSEPHIAQSPLNPNLLIAASKQYNRDPDSLAEYEFKVGSYISFDGGRTWTDLGPTNVCPQDQAPPESWPENTCYPEDDPSEQGTGGEDGGTTHTAIDVVPQKVRSEVRERGGRGVRDFGEVKVPSGEQLDHDFGEEYITSDPWVQFDDEGNAYLMVLDSPPYEHGNGWGMSFHRWETPSPQDVQSADTWSNRIVINDYPNDVAEFFLDDKNTFAVNNAGPDNDGEIGPMVACWGQNIPPAIKQQTVCERSTDGGRTWPERPRPISGPQQLVIGVSVVADNVNPNRFYATWLHYATGITGAPSEYWFSQSIDGGINWSPPSVVTQVDGLPTQMPGSDFRNLSIPIMAAGPEEGELYVTYAEYLDAVGDGDFDGKQADIRMVRSTNGGVTWTMPQTVNEEPVPVDLTQYHDPDQFQPTVAVTPSGQVNVAWFDRRHDPGNFHIDTYMARSNDGGQNFTETRVSHDMWDPRINPPISGSGEFIGDYQGLVADDCNSIPFMNDTHLANDPGRDPDFDAGDPRSQFQEVFSWRVPNTGAYGGQPVAGVDCAAAPIQDFDGDGVADAQDGCPNQPGSISSAGCPPGTTPRGAPRKAGRCGNRIKGNRKNNRLRGTKAGDRIAGGKGDDRLKGGAGADCLRGGPGDDRLHGGKGRDVLKGGPGRDVLNSRDGKRDVVRCGKGDRAKTDRRDVLRGCA